MDELTIRPTLKLIKLGAGLLLIAVIGFDTALFRIWGSRLHGWEFAAPLLILLWPLARLARRQFVKAVVSGDRLRYEAGAAARVIRTIQLSKVQDVRVQQSILQRALNVGDISIETAGEASRLTIPRVESAQAVADEITTRAQRALRIGVGL